MVDIREYSQQDYYEVSQWFRDQTGHDIPRDLLSNIGFIVPGIAAGFLITTNVNCCFLEPFIANPDIPSANRDIALRKILTQLEQAAEKLNIRITYGISTSPTMLDRAKSSGWIELGEHKLVAKGKL